MNGYIKYLNKIVDTMFTTAWHRKLSSMDLAIKSGLCYQTIRNLENRVTERPQLRTVYLLAKALGMGIMVYPIAKRKVG